MDAEHYYNENDEFAADWLETLIEWGEIPYGVVDRRSIVEVKARELSRHTQCHFFAGIGGWAYALKLAGVPPTERIWTGSCPCQPFSVMGLKKGEQDERHLWPVFHGLVDECHPPVVYGEQVASDDGLEWLSGVRADLQASGYEVGAADLAAAGVTAPHIRQRLYWVGDANDSRLERHARYVRESRRAEAVGSVAAPGGAVPWNSARVITDKDGRRRRCEPGTSPMAYRLPAHVGLLRAYGNVIVPQVAARFVRAHREAA